MNRIDVETKEVLFKGRRIRVTKEEINSLNSQFFSKKQFFNKYLFIPLTILFLVSTFFTVNIFAEQMGGSPTNTNTSRFKSVYDSLEDLGYGSEEAGVWGDWGGSWNRIRSAAEWVPSGGTATASDVMNGKTFYGGSRELQTGTFESALPNYEAMSVQDKPFHMDTNGSASWPTWTKTNTTPEVWKDERTGLYWSPKQGTATNQFNMTSCDYYSTVPRGNYNGLDADCGNAINLCGTLSLDANGDGTPDTKWYLPTQSEFLLTYLHGIYLSTSATWLGTEYYWTSTEVSSGAGGTAYQYYSSSGNIGNVGKFNSNAVRCSLRYLD